MPISIKNLNPCSVAYMSSLFWAVVVQKLPCEMVMFVFSISTFNDYFVFLFTAEPLPLMDLCRRSVRLALGKERLNEIEELPLPESLKGYLLYH